MDIPGIGNKIPRCQLIGPGLDATILSYLKLVWSHITFALYILYWRGETYAAAQSITHAM